MHSALGMCLMTALMSGQPETETRGITRFERADANHDGVVTADEFPYPRLFARIDSDHDGRITRQEAADFGDGSVGGVPPTLLFRRDVVYVERNRSRTWLTSLDIYQPREQEGEFLPVVVYVHGGAWSIGDKARVQSKPAHFVEAGFVFVSLNYRLSPDVTHPAHVEDVASALAWIHAHAREFGGDPERVILTGHSAGAHLVALVATDPTYLEAHDLDPAWLRGVVPLDSASYDLEARRDDLAMRGMIRAAFGRDPELLRDASPIRHVNADRRYPPFCVVYAGQRRDARQESERFVEALRGAGADVELVRAEGKDHGAVNSDVGVEGDEMTAAIDAFIRRAIRDHDELPVRPPED
ncbi:MAG: alpha/beta hydrolase fold domain-containing protein [Phycisphaeraceae bacterium]|nr:alpha/beta hydrolase fold domain-containing protein [Phycisphaeraceae bacterium]